MNQLATGALTDSRLAALCAERTRAAFFDYEARFEEITQRARDRFLTRDWRGSFGDARERLLLYSIVLDGLTSEIGTLMGERLRARTVWTAIKAVYSALIAQSVRLKVAESFFNSLTRRVFATAGVDQAIEFVDTDFDAPPAAVRNGFCRLDEGALLAELISGILANPETGFSAEKFHDLPHDAAVAARRLIAALPRKVEVTIEVCRAVFYRGRGAYLVGRMIANGVPTPVAFCLRQSQASGITLDAVLIGEADLAILFSYTRASLRVQAASPHELVEWLGELMPRKRTADLYNAIGYNRHAKTEFYRDFVRHLRSSSDCFVEAEGTRGMVMIVFTLPGYDVVFKLIRDRFDAPKESDRADVMERYRLVFEHDRAGRMVEAHEFEHLRIARTRFAPALLEELLRDAAETVRVEGDDVIIGHAYVERRVRPLNLYLAEADEKSSIAAACDYAQAIKDLARSNIFTGDLLTKNFGLTRHCRVVFYDYDELMLLTECNFRTMPQPQTEEQEMAAEPWFSVRPNDIFPEEFPNFLFFPASALKALFEKHGDIFRPGFWQNVQERLRAGDWPEIPPYSAERRLVAA